ncbi:MAG: hypothetical protein ACRDOT_09800 [Aeromicrobium sp.]
MSRRDVIILLVLIVAGALIGVFFGLEMGGGGSGGADPGPAGGY